ncbi:hypothetical protein ACFX2I_034426 [Malus domestica]
MASSLSHFPILLLSILFTIFRSADSQSFIGVNYQVANNLSPPSNTAKLLQSTSIKRVHLYSVDPAIIKALAGSCITIVIDAANGDIPALTSDPNATGQWVNSNVLPFYPASKIDLINVGNEVLLSNDQGLISQLLLAMRNVQSALTAASLDGKVRVSTVHSMAVLVQSDPPSVDPRDSTHSNLLQLDDVIRPNSFINFSRYHKVDVVRSALNAVGFKDIDILIAETGWPYHGDDNEIGPSVENARAYNGNLIAHLRSMVGTPLMPGQSVETYIFALYDEDLKPGPASERYFGLFKPDLTATYDVGLTKSSQMTHLKTFQRNTPSTPTVSPSPKPTSAQWCVPKSDVFIAQLQANLDYACGHGIDCSAIQPGGACFDPNTVASHAAYAINLYYHIVVTVPLNCNFSQTATLTSSNPNKFSLTRAHIEMAQVYHDEDAHYTKGYPGGSTGLPVEAGKVNIISNNGFVRVRNQLDIRNKVLVYFFVVFNLYM